MKKNQLEMMGGGGEDKVLGRVGEKEAKLCEEEKEIEKRKKVK